MAIDPQLIPTAPVAPVAPPAQMPPGVLPGPPGVSPEMPMPVPMPPPGMPGQPAAPPMAPPFAPPGVGQPGMPGQPGQPGQPEVGPDGQPLTPEQMVEQEAVKQGAEDARDEGTDDTFGQGERPHRGSSQQHPLDRAATQLSSELRFAAPRLAADLFPNGPAGTVQPSQEALAAYMRRHWDDATFRQTMLDRMAPKGPDGKRVPWGIKAYLKLYKDSIAPHAQTGDLAMPVVGPPGQALPSGYPQLEAPMEPQPIPGLPAPPPQAPPPPPLPSMPIEETGSPQAPALNVPPGV